MPFTLTMPKLSPTMEEGTITKWHKKVGDHVKAGDVLFEVATDKATVEHSALDPGYLQKILVEEGKEAIVNQPVAIFTEKKEESIEGYIPEGVTPRATSKEEAPIKEEKVEEKVVQKIAAPKKAGGLEQPAFVPEPPLAKKPAQKIYRTEAYVVASPLAKKLAKEKGIDLTTVKGSGPNERVMSRDLNVGQPDLPVTFGRHAEPKLAAGTYEEEHLTPIRKVIAHRLQESKTFIPHFYVSQEINVDQLTILREQLKAHGLKVSVNDLIIRACALSLKDHPDMNSGFNSVHGTIIRFKTIDISVAVSTDAGLITPIVRHADFKSVGEISAEVKELALKARDGKLSREEYMGGSFTISNMGMYGVTDFIGIINPPQACLLAVSAITEKPIVKEGQIVIGKTMQVTLSCDHRVVDGADAAKFLTTVKKYVENPSILLI